MPISIIPDNKKIEVLKAFCLKYPKIASRFFLTTTGEHKTWNDLLNPSDDKSDEDIVPSSMIAFMMNKAVKIYKKKGLVSFENGNLPLNLDPNNLQVESRFFRILPEARSEAILDLIDDENLPFLISGMLDYIFNSYDPVEENKDRVKDVLRNRIKFARLAEASKDLSDLERERLKIIIDKSLPTPEEVSLKDKNQIQTDEKLQTSERYKAQRAVFHETGSAMGIFDIQLQFLWDYLDPE
ncbi:MAG: hypothetical protein NT079_02855, partial [Candidatus Omnitrophica bacterium]|nr:hypothetical protein [Candidatus Omnitrophota bacterium]